jgi:hypothetical protein
MELVAATEDAAAARAELRSARAELARTRAQQATVRTPLFFSFSRHLAPVMPH